MTVWVPNQLTIGSVLDPLAIQRGPGAAFGDIFQPIVLGVDHSVQCEGTFSGTTNIQIHGSNDATTTTNGQYHALTDPYSNTINMGSAQIRQTTEVTVWIKPVISS